MSETPLPIRPPVLEARLNPSADVTAAISVVKSTCSAWVPVTIDAAHPLSFSAEAELCDQITGRTQPADTAYDIGLGQGVLGTLVAIAVFVVVRGGYRGIRHMISRRFSAPAADMTI